MADGTDAALSKPARRAILVVDRAMLRKLMGLPPGTKIDFVDGPIWSDPVRCGVVASSLPTVAEFESTPEVRLIFTREGDRLYGAWSNNPEARWLIGSLDERLSEDDPEE